MLPHSLYHGLPRSFTRLLSVAIIAIVLITAYLVSSTTKPHTLGLTGILTAWHSSKFDVVNTTFPVTTTSNDGENKNLGFSSNIYVISLPHRTDRRKEMEILRRTLGLTWPYITAVDTKDPIVDKVFQHVEIQRFIASEELKENTDDSLLDAGYSDPEFTAYPFRWPEDIDSLSSSSYRIPLSGSDLWFSSNSSIDYPLHFTSSLATQPLICATQNNKVPKHNPDLQQHSFLTRARVACWYSHLSVLRRIVDAGDSRPALVLEDDIDMEWDIHDRLAGIWGSLPTDWDVVYLGHCWSNESYFPPLASHTPTNTSLHPSHSPLCAHAYVLSPQGARRILLHFLYPPFAFSRAIDEALQWLIESGRVKGFSVVPSVVAQRKDSESDIVPGQLNEWKGELADGVLNRWGHLADT